MPGYDGTGPRGRGPMTGKGDGYCVLEIPEDPHQLRTGLVGLTGRPVTLPPMCASSDVMLSGAQIARIQSALLAMERCLQDLEIAVRCMGGENRSAVSAGTAVRSDRGAS
jgi:hypothetical protein